MFADVDIALTDENDGKRGRDIAGKKAGEPGRYRRTRRNHDDSVSACETSCAIRVGAVAAILESPARRRLQATCVLVAQVVGVRLALWCQVVEPHQ